jgi:hypothetical protein
MLISFAKYQEGFAAAAKKEDSENLAPSNLIELRPKAPEEDPVVCLSKTLTHYKKKRFLSGPYLPLALSVDAQKGEIGRLFLTKLDRPLAVILTGESGPRRQHMEYWKVLLKRFSDLSPEEYFPTLTVLDPSESMAKLIYLSEQNEYSMKANHSIFVLQFDSLTEKVAKLIDGSLRVSFITAKAKSAKNDSFLSMFLDGKNQIDIMWPQVMLPKAPVPEVAVSALAAVPSAKKKNKIKPSLKRAKTESKKKENEPKSKKPTQKKKEQKKTAKPLKKAKTAQGKRKKT